MAVSVLLGDCLELLAAVEADSVDATVTDPPYELGFMGKKWDSTGIAYSTDLWSRVLRAMKPGAHLVAFGGSRTYHRMACAIEDAGFEIRDSLMWLYGTGFPKSLNLPGGIGTALKPAHEPIVLARKPLMGTVLANVLLHRTGALNIDAARTPGTPGTPGTLADRADATHSHSMSGPKRSMGASYRRAVERGDITGRWPANVLLDEAAAEMLDRQTGELQSGFMSAGTLREGGQAVALGYFSGIASVDGTYGDAGGASRFFYTAKPSRSERDAGLDDLEPRTAGQATGREDGSAAMRSPRTGAGRSSEGGVRNHHPTVKPVAVMEWLVDLVAPPGGLVLDPFVGSGTTGVAAVRRGRSFVGMEREAEYVEIATRRIAHWSKGQLDLLGRIA